MLPLKNKFKHMKKITLLFVLFSAICFAQTKQETVLFEYDKFLLTNKAKQKLDSLISHIDINKLKELSELSSYLHPHFSSNIVFLELKNSEMDKVDILKNFFFKRRNTPHELFHRIRFSGRR